MSDVDRETIALAEYRPRTLPREALPEASGELLWRQYSTEVAVEFPSPTVTLS
jgi:5-methylcytosine-specific restriction enzyme subunit McrC